MRKGRAYKLNCSRIRRRTWMLGLPSEEDRWMSDLMSAVSIVSSTSPVLSLMRWVHETMKQDLVEAHSKSVQEFVNCCNWQYQVILWKKKEFSKIDKDQFCQSAFGTLPSQLQYNGYS